MWLPPVQRGHVVRLLFGVAVGLVMGFLCGSIFSGSRTQGLIGTAVDRYGIPRARDRLKCSEGDVHPNLRRLLLTGKVEFDQGRIIPEWKDAITKMWEDPEWAATAKSSSVGRAFTIGAWHYMLAPNRSLEVGAYYFLAMVGPIFIGGLGFAGGGSVIEFLASHQSQKSPGQHIAIDPHERTLWKGLGLKYAMEFLAMTRQRVKPSQLPPAFTKDPYIEVVGDSNLFAWYNKPSSTALGVLAEKKEKFDFMFLDGGHLFEENMVEGTVSVTGCII